MFTGRKERVKARLSKQFLKKNRFKGTSVDGECSCVLHLDVDVNS